MGFPWQGSQWNQCWLFCIWSYFQNLTPPPPPTHPTGPCDACLKLHHQSTSTSQTGSSPSRTTLATSLPLAVIRNLSRVSTFRRNAVMGSSDMPNRSSTWPSGTWYTMKWWQSRTYIATTLMDTRILQPPQVVCHWPKEIPCPGNDEVYQRKMVSHVSRCLPNTYKRRTEVSNVEK